MPAIRFFAMFGVINRIEAEDRIEAVMIAAIGANPGERGKVLREYVDSQEQHLGSAKPPVVSTLVPGVAPMAGLEETAGEIAELRARQRQADERIRAEWEAQRASRLSGTT